MDELHQLLVARQLGSGYSRIQPQVHASIDTAWQPVGRAMAMLPERLQDTMPDVRVGTRNLPEGWQARQVTNAYIDRSGKPGITVLDDPQTAYRRGDPKELAGILTHEKYHVEHAPGEGPAYDAQIAMLRQLGAPKSMIQSVLDTRNSVVK